MSTGQQQEEGGLKVNYQDISHILQTSITQGFLFSQLPATRQPYFARYLKMGQVGLSKTWFAVQLQWIKKI
jgi:hypothetical protein